MKKKLLTGLLALTMAFSLVPMSGTVWADDTVTFLNDGYPYGKDMSSGAVTLVMDVEGAANTYQWQMSEFEDGPYSAVAGQTLKEMTIDPEDGMWYRCVVDGTESKAVQTITGEFYDDRTWTALDKSTYYISNGTMAYTVKDSIFNVVGLYTKNGTEYMMQTTSNFTPGWEMYSSTDAEPEAKGFSATRGGASLDAFRVAFDEDDAHTLVIEADLADGQQAFGFYADLTLGNGLSTGPASDRGTLQALIDDDQVKQVSMLGTQRLSSVTNDDSAFTIRSKTDNCLYWIGSYSDGVQIYTYNTNGVGNVKETATVGGVENVATLVENGSGMGISWTKVSSGETAKFEFAVGSVSEIGATEVSANPGVNYVNETITGLDANTTYNVTSDNVTYSVTSASNGTVSLTGTDKNGKAYDFFGKTISLVKVGGRSAKTLDIAGRPATPAKLTDSDSNGSIEHGTDYFIITPVSGLQYAYSTDGTNWTILTDDDKDSSGRYYVKGLSANQVYISTRVIATETAPVSAWSEAATIILKTDAGSTTGTGVNTPKTGDENSLVLWGSILACGMAVLGIVVVSRRKRQNVK